MRRPPLPLVTPLLSSLALLLRVGAAVGAAAVGRSAAADAAPAAGGALALLSELPALPVPHYSWPFCHLESSCTADFMRTALPWSDAAVMREFARITGSVSAYAGLHIYSNLTDSEIDTMWEKLAAGVGGADSDATIAVPLEIAAAAGGGERGGGGLGRHRGARERESPVRA